MAFMRQYGMDMGDPGPRPAPRRKSAAAGPRAKAGRKRMVRAQRAARGRQGAPKAPGKKGRKGGGPDPSKLFGMLGSKKEFIGKLKSGNLLGGVMSGLIPEGMGGSGGERKAHRTRNPANVKALRKALSRVEGFGRLVKRVNRMLPSSHRFQVHPVLKHKRRRKGA